MSASSVSENKHASVVIRKEVLSDGVTSRTNNYTQQPLIGGSCPNSGMIDFVGS